MKIPATGPCRCLNPVMYTCCAERCLFSVAYLSKLEMDAFDYKGSD